jgi:hypothetical protein
MNKTFIKRERYLYLINRTKNRRIKKKLHDKILDYDMELFFQQKDQNLL